ncbi:hypothetical protein [Chelatococcus asaccharovorans]|uniref:hypothetical protein n=1 Tax=Chelatococcus asaccharovorans TaxID=28210 RepID=UPI0022651FFC|nr:hypothetical protein [Chelatococcus asaccharovorans]
MGAALGGLAAAGIALQDGEIDQNDRVSVAAGMIGGAVGGVLGGPKGAGIGAAAFGKGLGEAVDKLAGPVLGETIGKGLEGAFQTKQGSTNKGDEATRKDDGRRERDDVEASPPSQPSSTGEKGQENDDSDDQE